MLQKKNRLPFAICSLMATFLFYCVFARRFIIALHLQHFCKLTAIWYKHYNIDIVGRYVCGRYGVWAIMCFCRKYGAMLTIVTTLDLCKKNTALQLHWGNAPSSRANHYLAYSIYQMACKEHIEPTCPLLQFSFSLPLQWMLPYQHTCQYMINYYPIMALMPIFKQLALHRAPAWPSQTRNYTPLTHVMFLWKHRFFFLTCVPLRFKPVYISQPWVLIYII